MKATNKEILAAVSLFSAIAFGALGSFVAPQGIIDSSMLYLIAQFLVFSATLLGFGDTVHKIQKIAKEIKEEKK